MVKIEKIVLKIGDRELSLSPEEVKGLKEALNKMFGDKSVVYRYYPSFPYYNPAYSPNWIFTSGPVTLCASTEDAEV